MGKWWKVDFGFTATVTRVIIMSRPDCCSERMNGAEVFLLIDGERNTDTSQTISFATDGQEVVLCYDDVENVSGVEIVVNNPDENSVLNVEIQRFDVRGDNSS